MRYSVNVPNSGEFAAPEVFAEVARRAEEAGWDALLVWDHVVEQKELRRKSPIPGSCSPPQPWQPAGSGWAPQSRPWPAGGRPSWPGK
jgi:alkanesulfonate monooxygenase SsuD/methylene tetrahydromethanopterin reductase-like flavin-dependent oxidoreductase (luciferase family)